MGSQKCWGGQKNLGVNICSGSNFVGGQYFLGGQNLLGVKKGWGSKLNYKTLTYPPPPLDTFADKIPLVLMGGRAEGQACADP